MAHATETGVPSDPSLVERARRGDAAAFDALAGALIADAYRLAKAILGDEADAAAATENALVAAWRELPRLHELDRFDAWFRRSLVDECRMALRRRDRSGGAGNATGTPGSVRSGPASEATELTTADAVDALERAYERLDPADRVLLAVHHLGRVPLVELAELVHLPVGPVKWRLHEAQASLLGALETT